MKVESIIQKDNVNTLKDEFINNSSKGLKKMYIFLGTLKETGFDILEECLIDNKARKTIAFAYDKKNTTKKMLDNLIKYTKNIWVHNNNLPNELNSNIWIFENDKKSYVYFLSGNVSSSNLTSDIHIYTKIEFDIADTKERKEYDSFVFNLTELLKDESFVKLSKEYIEELLNNKEIFSTKQYVFNVPSLSDLINNGTIKKSGINKDIDSSAEENVSFDDDDKLPHIELDKVKDVSFDIDISEAKEFEKAEVEEEIKPVNKQKKVKEESTDEIDIDPGFDKEYVIPKEDLIENEQVEEEIINESDVIDMEKEIFSSSTIKFNKKSVESKKKEIKEENITKKIDLTKVSNLIMELPKKPTKGKDVAAVKVPNYIKESIPLFFEVLNNAKTVTKSDGSRYKEGNINLEIIDVNENKKYIDKLAKLSIRAGQTYISFISDILSDISYDEDDIVRIIKLSKDSYHMEIIPKGLDEYEFWKKLCTQNFKSSVRCYGMM